MDLERHTIEKKDFPIGRRGYEPEAVDAHLRALADEVERLKHGRPVRTETLASTASEQVRAIVDAAESSAAAIQRQAEEEAREMRDAAGSEAQETRSEATAQAREYVGRVSRSAAAMLQRLDSMESELGTLVESLRAGSNRVVADLRLLESELVEVREAVVPAHAQDVARAAELERPSEPVDESEPQVEPAAEPQEIEELPKEGSAPEPSPAPVGTSGGGDGQSDLEGARLVALNMALNGTPREETDRYLAENFDLHDRGGLLDEVYSSVEG